MKNGIRIYYECLSMGMPGVNKSYEFSDKINVIYGRNQCGKSTLINSIFMALGAEDTIFYGSELIPENAALKIKYLDVKNGAYEREYFRNKLNSTKIKYKDFLSKNVGIDMHARIDNKYGSKSINLLDLAAVFYFSQKIDDSENKFRATNLSKDAVDDIINYLINNGNNEVMNLKIEEAKLKKKKADMQLSINIDAALKLNNSDQVLAANKEIENTFSDLEYKLEQLDAKISKEMLKKFESKKELKNNDWNTRSIEKIKEISMKISKKYGDKTITLWDLIYDLNMMMPMLSIEEMNFHEHQLRDSTSTINKLNKDREEILNCLSKISYNTRIELRKSEIKDLLIHSGSLQEKMLEIESNLKITKNKIVESEDKIVKIREKFDAAVGLIMRDLEIQKSDTGVGQQISRIIKMIKYQDVVSIPILLDGFMDGGTYENKVKMFKYIKSNISHQIIICCTISDENDKFFKYLEGEDVTLHHIEK